MGLKSDAPSMGGMEDATQRSIKLQRKMYEQGREDLQPWYQAGAGGISRLSDLLGISGGSMQGREDIYNELLPQYTQQGQAGGGQWLGMGGQLFGSEDLANQTFRGREGERLNYQAPIAGGGGKLEAIRSARQFQPQAGAVTDFDALNAAVEGRLGEQTTPEGYGSLLEGFTGDDFQTDPGYQFRQQEAQKTLERSMAAQGITLGGGGLGSINPQVARAMEEQSQGLASQEYGQAYNRYNQDQSNVYSRLLGVSGLGQGSASQMANAGQQYGTNVGNLRTGLAGAQYQHDQSEYARGTPFENVMGAWSPAYSDATGRGQAGQQFRSGMSSMFSDSRLKDNIELVGHEMGHNIYEFDYKDGSGRYRGVMAQEVLKTEPDAVSKHSNGFYMVDYDKLGLKMEAV